MSMIGMSGQFFAGLPYPHAGFSCLELILVPALAPACGSARIHRNRANSCASTGSSRFARMHNHRTLDKLMRHRSLNVPNPAHSNHVYHTIWINFCSTENNKTMKQNTVIMHAHPLWPSRTGCCELYALSTRFLSFLVVTWPSPPGWPGPDWLLDTYWPVARSIATLHLLTHSLSHG